MREATKSSELLLAARRVPPATLEDRHEADEERMHELRAAADQAVLDLGESESLRISDRQDLESLLRKNEALFRSLVQGSRDVVAVIDGSGHCTYVSPGVFEVGGFTDQEVMGRSGFEFIHPDDREMIAAALRDIVGSPRGQKTVEVRTRIKGGGWIWIEMRAANRFDDPSIRGIVLNYHDITERMVAADRISKSEQLFRGAFDSARAGIALIGTDGMTYIDVNQSFCDMLGYSKSELMALGWKAVTHPEDIEDNIQETADFLAGETRTNVISKRYIHKNGSPVSVEVNDALIRGPEGQPAYLVAHITDVTERDRSIKDRERLEAQIRQGQKMEAVGELAGGIAHDFNNLLAVISNYAAFLREDMAADDARLRDVDEIIKAGDRAAGGLVHQLLAFSRKELITPRVIDLNEAIADLHEILSRSLGGHIDLVFEADENLPNTRADRGQIEQVVLNLVVNARDAMPDGGELVISTSSETVGDDRPGLTAGTYVKLVVSDTGQGMDPATAERAFEPFFTTKKRGEGTGLGLSTVYGNVKQANGFVYIDSDAGIGTKFSIYLPMTDEDAEIVDEVLVRDSIGGSERILLVEDEDGVRDVAARILTSHGYEVTSFGDGEAALEFYRSHLDAIDLLITDVVMPKMSGKHLSDEATAIDPALKTLFMSGYTEELIAQRGALDVRDNLLKKPFKAEELLIRVRLSLDAGSMA